MVDKIEDVEWLNPLSETAPQSELAVLRQNQKALSGALSQREEFYRNVLDSLAEGVLITNEESRIIYANEQITSMTGYSREELIGRISYELLSPPENWPTMQRRLQERLSGNTEYYEHELVRKDGSSHRISVKASPYRNARGEIVGTVGALSCLQRQRSLELENAYLLDEIKVEGHFGDIVGSSPALQKVLEQIKVVAATEATVLIQGESGTGKELVARAIHEHSGRRGKPMVRVNCASIPRELFESEFFGHVRGAFTGAIKDRVGRFELAEGGTLLLDEVGEIPIELQSKLLRVLQEGQYEKVGEDRTRTTSVRILAATNRELLADVRAGRFRQDLYYRISVFPVDLPPLRERREDIAPLAEHFLRLSSQRMGISTPRLLASDRRRLEEYDWPGNVRELQNVIERAVILAQGGDLRFYLEPLAPGLPIAKGQGPRPTHPAGKGSLRDLKTQESEMIHSALEQTQGKVYGHGGAAELLGIKPTTLLSKMKRLGMAGPRQWRRGG